jgi:hypothetical protein
MVCESMPRMAMVLASEPGGEQAARETGDLLQTIW